MATDELLLLLLMMMMMMKMTVMKNAVGVFKKSMFQKSVMKSQQAIKNSTFKFGTTHRKFQPSFSPSRPPPEAVKRRKAAF